MEKCPDCGATIGGRSACQTLWDKLATEGYIATSPWRTVAFDAYCMQHLERYCLSAKSYFAHLTRLCCGLEYEGRPEVYSALQKWLNGSVQLQKPSLLPFLGELTIADVQRATTQDEADQLIGQWVNEVWQAYSSQHELAQTTIKMVLRHVPAPKRK